MHTFDSWQRYQALGQMGLKTVPPDEVTSLSDLGVPRLAAETVTAPITLGDWEKLGSLYKELRGLCLSSVQQTPSLSFGLSSFSCLVSLSQNK